MYAESSPLVRARLSNGVLLEAVQTLLILTEAKPETWATVGEFLKGVDDFLSNCSQDKRVSSSEPLVWVKGSDVRDWTLEDSTPALKALGCSTTEPLLYEDEHRMIVTLSEFREIVSSLDSEM